SARATDATASVLRVGISAAHATRRQCDGLLSGTDSKLIPSVSVAIEPSAANRNVETCLRAVAGHAPNENMAGISMSFGPIEHCLPDEVECPRELALTHLIINPQQRPDGQSQHGSWRVKCLTRSRSATDARTVERN